MKKIFAAQVQVGMTLPCDVYNAGGVLLWVAGSKVKNDQQVVKLAKEGYRSDLQEWLPPHTSGRITDNASNKNVKIQKTYVYHTVMDAMMEIQLPLIYIFDVFKSDSFHKEKHDLRAQINSVVDVILDYSRRHRNETIATLHMFHNAKFTLIHAMHVASMTAMICNALKLSDEDTRTYTSAALTANSSIIKLQDSLQSQKTGITGSQKERLINHPYETLMLLTRAGIRDDKWLDAVLMHHELIDGSGFPRQLKDNDIPIGAKIIAAADQYISLVMPRKSIDPPTALKTVCKRYAKRIDTAVIRGLINILGVMPPGTFVTLKEGGIGLVIVNTKDKSKPKIAKIGDTITNFYSEFTITSAYTVIEVVRAPTNVPKKIYKLWAQYDDQKKKKLVSLNQQQASEKNNSK